MMPIIHGARLAGAAGLLLLAAAAAVGQEPVVAPERSGGDATELGRTYTAWFYDGAIDEVWSKMSPEMQGALGSVEALRAFREQVAQQIGAETSVVSERVDEGQGLRVYVRHAQFEKVAQVIDVAWAFDAEGVVQGFQVRPPREPAPSTHLAYETKTPLRLPFDGKWYVFWGGRTLEQNYHAVSEDQRFAYDLVVRQDGSTHTGDGSSNEMYHCWGRPILAPAAGRVVVAVDGVDDNRPGEMNAAAPPGNHVVLDHGNGEFSFLAHLRKGSVAVKPAQSVEAGARLGLCGNSGNTSEPHLHYHLQTTAVFNGGEGLPAQFLNYLADGAPVARGEPEQGQTIEPAPATPAGEKRG